MDRGCGCGCEKSQKIMQACYSRKHFLVRRSYGSMLSGGVQDDKSQPSVPGPFGVKIGWIRGNLFTIRELVCFAD